MATGTRVNKVVSYKDRKRTITREKRIIRRPEILANRLPRRVTLRTQLARNVGRITSENAIKELQYVTSAVKRVILLEDAPPRFQMITEKIGIKDHNSDLYKL